MNNKIKFAYRGATRFEVVFAASVKEPEDLDKLLKEIKSIFFNIIHDCKSMRVVENGAYTLFPECMLEDIVAVITK